MPLPAGSRPFEMSSIVNYDEGKLYFSYGTWAKYQGNPYRFVWIKVWTPCNIRNQNGWYGFRFLRLFEIDMNDKTIMAVRTCDTLVSLRGKRLGLNTFRFKDKTNHNLHQLDLCLLWQELVSHYWGSLDPSFLEDHQVQELSTHPALIPPT